jgi:hypothetical protein
VGHLGGWAVPRVFCAFLFLASQLIVVLLLLPCF